MLFNVHNSIAAKSELIQISIVLSLLCWYCCGHSYDWNRKDYAVYCARSYYTLLHGATVWNYKL